MVTGNIEVTRITSGENISNSEIETKYCPRCRNDKSTDDFYHFSSGKLSDYCRECWRDKRKEYQPKKESNSSSRQSSIRDGLKYCKRCDEAGLVPYLPLDKFYYSNGKYSGYCRIHQNQYRRELRMQKNPNMKPRIHGSSDTNGAAPNEEPRQPTEKELRLEQGEKYCPVCQDFKPLSEFYKRSATSHLFTSYCKTHHNSASKRVKKPNSEV